jgi:hypothetical protein
MARRVGVGLFAVMACMATIAVGSAGAATTPPQITAVTYSGSSFSPTVTVSGKGFGGKAPASVAVGTLSNCPAESSGSDYGTNFEFFDNTASLPWSAGGSKGVKPGTQGACVGMVVSQWTATKVVFTFGNQFGNFVLSNGNNYALGIKGYWYGGLVSGLS